MTTGGGDESDAQPVQREEGEGRTRSDDEAVSEPSTDELQEPSTEKEPGEEPRAPGQAEPEPSHEAVGIGVIGGPQPDSAADSEPPSGDPDETER